jgi:aryl-alcohol dehydrogenase-like predicted oxidoreductase
MLICVLLWIEECDLSLKQLGTDYIDLLQLNYPPQKFQYAEIFEAINALKNQGKIRDFGICNFHGEDIENFLNCGVKQFNVSIYFIIQIMMVMNIILNYLLKI